MSQARNLAKFAQRSIQVGKLAVAQPSIVLDVEPDTLYRGSAKVRATVDAILYSQVAFTPGAWIINTSYSYQQMSASGTATSAGAVPASGIALVGLDAGSAWSGLIEFLFYSGSPTELAHITLFGGSLDTQGAARIYVTDGVQNSASAAAQVRFILDTGNLMIGSRVILDKLG